MTSASRPAGLPPFRNEPILELRRSPQRESLTDALRALDATLPLGAPVLIGGDAGSEEGIESTDPGAPDRLVATAGAAGKDEVAAAVGAAAEAGRAWSRRPAAERAAILDAAAASLRERRLELAAL